MTKHTRKLPRVNNWEDRPGNARPTPERLAKGTFKLVDAEDAGVKTAVNQDDQISVIQRLAESEVITGRQGEAGDKFRDLHDRFWPQTSPRTCLNIDPVGHESLEDSDEEVRVHAAWRELAGVIPKPEMTELKRVCVAGYPPSDIDRLRMALDLCAEFFRIRR